MKHPLSAILGGAGVGLLLLCAAGIVATLAGRALEPGVYALLGLGGLGLTVALDFGLGLRVAVRQAGQDLDNDRARTQALRVSTAANAWALRQAQHAAAVASGQAGAREAEVRERAWAVGLETLFRAIDKAGGASGRKLAGVVGSDTHPALMRFYTSPAGLSVLRDAGGNQGHVWGWRDTGEAWTLADVLTLIRAGQLPHPEGEVPDIKPLPSSAAQRNRPQRAAEVVVDQ